jgi:hypothetical protein
MLKDRRNLANAVIVDLTKPLAAPPVSAYASLARGEEPPPLRRRAAARRPQPATAAADQDPNFVKMPGRHRTTLRFRPDQQQKER